MTTRLAALVHAAVEAVCPIHGVSLGRHDDKSTWRVHFAPEATEAQRKKAQERLLSFSLKEDNPEDVGAPRVIR